MPDFTHESNYSEETSFSQIVFGSSAPVLETEMNELQEIIRTKFKYLSQLFGFNSGVIYGGSVSLSENIVTVSNCYVFSGSGLFAYINSASVEVSQENCNVYVTLTENTITGNDTIKSYGNTEGSIITNPIYDSRLGVETSRRKVITYTLSASSVVPNDSGTVSIGTFDSENQKFNPTYALNPSRGDDAPSFFSIMRELSYLMEYKSHINHKHSASDITSGVLPLEKGGTGESNRYDAYNSISLVSHYRGTYSSIDDARESGWNYFTWLNQTPTPSDYPSLITGYLYNINPHPNTSNDLLQIWVDGSPIWEEPYEYGSYPPPTIAIRHATSGGTSASDITFENWVKILTEKSLFLNRSYIKKNSSRVFGVFGVATGGSGSYEYTYYYQEDNGNLIQVITNTASHKFITGGVQIAFNSSTTNAYIKVKVKDTNTMEIQTKEFEIEFEGE